MRVRHLAWIGRRSLVVGLLAVVFALGPTGVASACTIDPPMLVDEVLDEAPPGWGSERAVGVGEDRVVVSAPLVVAVLLGLVARPGGCRWLCVGHLPP